MDDYYAILALDRSASVDEIGKKIRQELRVWPKRTANPDLSRRQEAERRVQLLGEAKAVLLDEEKRLAYDRQLAASRPTALTPDGSQTTSASVDWLAQARQYLSANNYNAALYAAREARTAGATTGEVWSLLCRANAGLGRLDDALYEAQQATHLDAGNPQVHIDLGGIHESRKEWAASYRAFEAAHHLTPAEDGPRLAMALIRAAEGRLPEAVTAMEQIYSQTKDREDVGRYLAGLLAQAAEAVPASRDGDEYSITSRDEITQMNTLLARARSVTNDPDALASVANVQQYVDKCASRPFNFARFRTDVLLYLAIGAALLTVCSCASSWQFAILTGLLTAGFLAGAIARARTPVWKTNYRVHLMA